MKARVQECRENLFYDKTVIQDSRGRSSLRAERK